MLRRCILRCGSFNSCDVHYLRMICRTRFRRLLRFRALHSGRTNVVGLIRKLRAHDLCPAPSVALGEVKIATPWRLKPQTSPEGRQPCSLSLPGSWFFAGLALCLKALLFLLEQLVEFDKKGAEFLRILLGGHLCRKFHQSFSLFALQMRFSSRLTPALGERQDTVSQWAHIQCVWYRTIIGRCANLRAPLAQSPMLRRLEDRIRELCASAVAAEEPELETILSELQSALREHTGRLRRLAAAKLTTLDENLQQERRAI